MKDVFISYKTEEFDEANWVKTTLETNGISCWMAPMCIPGGSSYAVEIPQAIRECKVFVLILSEKSQLSKWVPRELDQAINEGKTVLPFMLENCPLRDDFNFYLTNVQRYAAYESKIKAIEKMLKEIKALLGIHDAPQAEEKSEPAAAVREPEAPKSAPKTAEPVMPAVKAPEIKRKPVRPAPQKKATAATKKNKFLPLICAAAAVIVLVAGILIINAANTVVIAGEKFSKGDTYISLEDKTLTQEDMESFRKFKELSSVYIANCTLPGTDLSAVCESVQYRLELDNCGITNAHLASVDFEKMSIKALCLDNNPELSELNSIAPLGDTLTELSFSNCAVSDLSFLEGFGGLRSFVADNNAIADISVLSGCNELQEVSVSGNQLTNLDGLETAISLTQIQAADNDLENINGLSNTTLLTAVQLQGNKIQDISVLAKSAQTLKSIDLSGNGLADISVLSGCSLVTQLYINDNALTELSVVSGMPMLTTLWASGNQLTDISPLANCTALTDIDLSDNQITATDSLCVAETAYGADVDLSNNSITQLVLPAVEYSYLALYGNEISDLSPLNTTVGSTLVFDYHADIDFTALGQSDYYNYYIFDCPLDQQIAIGEALGDYKTNFTTAEAYLNQQT